MKLHDIFEDALNIDQKNGLGAVPNNQEIDYLGVEGYTKPSDFLKLASPLPLTDTDRKVVDKIVSYLRDGGAIASPYLKLDIKNKPFAVISHDGRHRMIAIQQVYGDQPILIHLFFSQGVRKKHITNEIIELINKGIVSQDSSKTVSNWFEPKEKLLEDCIVEAKRAFSGVRLDEIPSEYKNLKVLGRGTTSIALEKDNNTVIILTRDSIKKDWLCQCFGINLARCIGMADSNKHHIKQINTLPIYILEMPKLLPLNQQNLKTVRSLLAEFEEIRNEALYYCKSEDEYKRTIICNYSNVFKKFKQNFKFCHQLEQLMDFLENYDTNQYNFDLSLRNFRQTVDGKLVVLDPVVDKTLMDIYVNHKYGDRD